MCDYDKKYRLYNSKLDAQTIIDRETHERTHTKENEQNNKRSK